MKNNKHTLKKVLTAVALLATVSAAHADPVGELAQGCFAIQSALRYEPC